MNVKCLCLSGVPCVGHSVRSSTARNNRKWYTITFFPYYSRIEFFFNTYTTRSEQINAVNNNPRSEEQTRVSGNLLQRAFYVTLNVVENCALAVRGTFLHYAQKCKVPVIFACSFPARKRVKARCDIGRARVNRANSDSSVTSRVETKRGHFFVRASGEFANWKNLKALELRYYTCWACRVHRTVNAI